MSKPSERTDVVANAKRAGVVAHDKRAGIVAHDKRHVWHPYTPVDWYEHEADPLVIARASGAYLEDVDGRRYLDGNSSWWVAALGHNHPRLVRALRDQAEALCHCSLAGVTHEPAAALAAELCDIAPAGLSRVFYSDDGSTAVEVAVKAAAQYWAQNGRPERTRFVALAGAFHGETIGATSLGGVDLFRKPFASLLFDCLRVAPPYDEAAYEQAFRAIDTVIRDNANELAGVVVEPLVQGATGMRMYPPSFLSRLAERCRECDVFLIVDEVFTGYGRAGAMWASDVAGIAPDMVCTAKGFTGGMLPMAATLVTERIVDGFRGGRERAFFYGHSFCGNPLGAAVAREVLRVFRDEHVLEGIPRRHELLANAFRSLGELPGASSPRALGMIGAIDFDGGGYLGHVGWRVYEEARKRGAYIRPLGNTVYLTPPINIPERDLESLLGILTESVAAALEAQP